MNKQPTKVADRARSVTNIPVTYPINRKEYDSLKKSLTGTARKYLNEVHFNNAEENAVYHKTIQTLLRMLPDDKDKRQFINSPNLAPGEDLLFCLSRAYGDTMPITQRNIDDAIREAVFAVSLNCQHLKTKKFKEQLLNAQEPTSDDYRENIDAKMVGRSGVAEVVAILRANLIDNPNFIDSPNSVDERRSLLRSVIELFHDKDLCSLQELLAPQKIDPETITAVKQACLVILTTPVDQLPHRSTLENHKINEIYFTYNMDLIYLQLQADLENLLDMPAPSYPDEPLDDEDGMSVVGV